jgi:hypothetical protein
MPFAKNVRTTVRNDFLLHSNLTPFFWAKLAAPALLIGALASGCSSGVDGAPKFNEPVAPTTQAPASNTTQAPRPAPAASPTGSAASSTQTSTTPASNAASGSAANGNAASGNAANDGDAEDDDNANDNGDEALPTPPLDPGAAPEGQGGNDANGGGGNQNADDDEDEDEIGDDNGGDDDGDDNGGDDDDDDGDDDDDDDDGAGATPAPTPPPANPSPDAVTFTADIRSILLDNCGRCHASGGLPRFASNDAASSFDVAFQERNSIIQEIQSGNMPADTCNGAPGSNGCVSVADFNLIRQWVADGAPE